MSVTPWPSIPPTWLTVWVIWRFRNKPQPRPADIPKEIPKFAWGVLQWCEWKRNFEQGPRPAVPTKIPKWGWDVLRQLNTAVPNPKNPPPPPPPPPDPIPANSWTLPGPAIYTAWGWRLDWKENEEADRRAILQLMQDSGVKSVGLQSGQFDALVPSLCREYGFKIFLWGRADASQDAALLANHNFDGYKPQIEGVYEYEAAISALRAGVGAGRSLSIVTTLAGLETYTTRPDGSQTTVEVEALLDVGVTHASVECYNFDMQPLSVSTLCGWSAPRRGIYHRNPVVGLARPNITMANYRPDIDQYGRQVGVYLAEQMQNPRDWDAVRALGT